MSYEISILEDKRIKHSQKANNTLSIDIQSIYSDTNSQIHVYPYYVGPVYKIDWTYIVPHRHKDTHPNEQDQGVELSDTTTIDPQFKDFYGYHFYQHGWKFQFPDSIYKYIPDKKQKDDEHQHS